MIVDVDVSVHIVKKKSFTVIIFFMSHMYHIFFVKVQELLYHNYFMMQLYIQEG